MSVFASFPDRSTTGFLRVNQQGHRGRRVAVLGAFLVLALAAEAGAQTWSVVSPNGSVKLTVQLGASGDQAKQLKYRVEQGAEGNRSVVLGDSPLGLRLRGQDLATGLSFDSAQPEKAVEESYELLHGKRRECRNSGRQLTLAFRNVGGVPVELDLRAYNDGVAFRYRLPGKLTGAQVLEAELTGFALPPQARIWCAPSDKATMYAPAYETYYEGDMAPGTPSPLGVGWSFPMLFRTGEAARWALITEANVDGRFCGSRLSNDSVGGLYRIAFPNPAEGNGQGAVEPSATLPWEMPWRIVIVGDSLATLVESTLVTDVCPPCEVKDSASWVRPGRVAWSWWSDTISPKDAAKQRKFIDFAVEMGLEYVLVDANWTIMENGNIHDVLRYAKEKGIGVLLWYNSGGPHNVVTEKPRDCFTYPSVRQFELDLLQQWGVKGVKVDFFQSDKQDVMALYRGILQDAAAKHIMVNFHGCTLPRGWERTYPHLMSMEGVRGEECYIFDTKYPDAAPVQNTILPFTRNLVGPMDYTPMGFSDNQYPHHTTFAHELALSVVFESGWLHFVDKAEAYLGLPEAPKRFLKEVPVVWDDTRFVAGYPGQFTILARRKGDTWYLAGVNGENRVREETIKPGAWLGSGRRNLVVMADGQSARTFASTDSTFEPGSEFKVRMLPQGGFVAVLKLAK